MIVSRFCPVKEIGIFFYFFFNWHPKICFPSCYLFQWLTFTVQIDLCAKFHTQRLFHMDVLRRRSGFFQNGQGLIQKCLLKVLSKHTSVDTTLSEPLTFETCFSLPAFSPPPGLFSLYYSILSGLSGTVYWGRLRQVHWPAETLLYASELFPLTQWKNPVCRVLLLSLPLHGLPNVWPAPSLLLRYACLGIPDLYAVSLHPWLSLKYLELNPCQQTRFRFINILYVSIATVDCFHIGLRKEHSI